MKDSAMVDALTRSSTTKTEVEAYHQSRVFITSNPGKPTKGAGAIKTRQFFIYPHSTCSLYRLSDYSFSFSQL